MDTLHCRKMGREGQTEGEIDYFCPVQTGVSLSRHTLYSAEREVKVKESIWVMINL